MRSALQLHRIDDVRREARSAQLAYGFIRGRAYEQIEPTAKTPPDMERVRLLVQRYGPHRFFDSPEPYQEYKERRAEAMERIESWFQPVTV